MTPVSLCIINYNGLEYLQRAFSVIAEFREQFAEILVVDNGSTDGSLEFARSQLDVRVVALESNLGPGAARNQGFAQATHDRILFQDNDIELSPATTASLLATLAQDESTLAVAPRVVYRNQPDVIQFDSADCHALGLMTVRHANRQVAQTPAQRTTTTSIVTACFMIDRARWNSGQLFDETLIFNLEDHDFGVRACLLGYRLMVDETVQVRHGGGTDGMSWRPGYKMQSIRLYCLIRNRWWILLRYFSWRSLLLLLPFLLVFECLQFAATLLKGFPTVYIRALAATLIHLPQLLRTRRRMQRLRRCDDRLILRSGPLPLTANMRLSGFAGYCLGLFERSMGFYTRRILLVGEVKRS